MYPIIILQLILNKLGHGIFFEKLTIISFINLLCPIILKGLNFKNYLQRIMRCKVLLFQSNSVPNSRVFPIGARNKQQSTTRQKSANAPSYHNENYPPLQTTSTYFYRPTKHQFPCFNPIKVLAFQLLPLPLYHFCLHFILFVYSGHINFDFDQCSIFTGRWFYLWKRF